MIVLIHLLELKQLGTGTRTDLALQTAVVKMSAYDNKHKFVILLTDGVSNGNATNLNTAVAKLVTILFTSILIIT